MADGFKRFRDKINKPDHYEKGDYEPVKIIEAYDLDFFEGNILKYLLRYKKKNGLEDLEKAQWYLDCLIRLTEKRLAKKGVPFDDSLRQDKEDTLKEKDMQLEIASKIMPEFIENV